MNTKIKWITALKIWVVIYPSITLFYFLFGAFISALPLYLRTLLITIALVPWMVFVGVPMVDAIVGRITEKQTKNVR